MENITIEKVINFDNNIDDIESIDVSKDVKYNVLDDNSHVEGFINVSGKVKTLLESKEFNETINVDIFTPTNKEIDVENFKINIVDYSYVVNQKNLSLYVILNIDGIVDVSEKEEIKSDNEVLEINKLNVIEEQRDVKEEENVDEVKEMLEENKLIIKDNNMSDGVSKTWATDLFKLSDNYTLFMKISLKWKTH